MANGLLDFLSTPAGQGLLSAGLGVAANAGRGGTWNAIGRGGLMGMQGYAAATEQERMKQIRDMEMQTGLLGLNKAKREASTEEAMNTAARASYTTPNMAFEKNGVNTGPQMDGSALPTVNPGFDMKGYTDRLFGIDPLKGMAFQQAQAKSNAPIKLGAGDTLIDPVTMQPRYTAPEKAAPSNVAKLFQEMQSLPPNDPRRPFYENAVRKATTHAPASSATVVMKQEGEEKKAVGKFFGESYAEVQKSGLAAQGALNRYGRLGQLLEGVDTGKFAPLGVEMAKAAQSAGLNIDPNLGNKEAAIALSSEIALQLRNPSGGAGMPGAMSDADRNFLTGMVPGIEKTPEGRKLILETAKKTAQRDVQVARMAREYRQKRGMIDEGFYEQLAQFSEANPLFKGSAPAQPAGGGKAKFLGFE